MMLKTIISMAVSTFVLCVGCTKQPDSPQPDPQDPVSVEMLGFQAFAVTPEDNEGIYSSVYFALDKEWVWRGKIDHYKADVTQLKASFDAVAAKVTVNGKEQISGVTANDFSKPLVYTLYADDGQSRMFTVALENGAGSCPIVSIVTNEQAPVNSKEKWVPGRMVIDLQSKTGEKLVYDMEIKGRGNNTWRLPKKPYAIKLAEKSPVLGMAKQKRWVLLANASDRTLLRNRVAFELGRCVGMAWTPASRFVEVLLNRKYLGSYLLVEQIRVDMNRVNIAEMKPEDVAEPNITGGYLLEMDRYYDEPNKFRSAFRDLPVMIKEPDEEVLGREQLKYITDYVNHIEELLYGGAVVDEAYKEYLDMDSFIQWWIVTELTGNRDSRLPGSCYMYKDRGRKLCAGPLWDFDLTTFKSEMGFLLYDYRVEQGDDDYEKGQRSLWYERLFSDPEFKSRAKTLWQVSKGKLEGVADFIDAEVAALRPSALVNWEMWTISGSMNQDEQMSWDRAAQQLKINYLARLKWMGQEIDKW